MPKLIPLTDPIQPVESPLTLTALKRYVGGSVELVELLSGDIMVVNESADQPNKSASSLAGRPIFGPAVLCSPSEIA